MLVSQKMGIDGFKSPEDLIMRINELPKWYDRIDLVSNPGLHGNEAAALPLSHRASSSSQIVWYISFCVARMTGV